jgi:hypothetical protein
VFSMWTELITMSFNKKGIVSSGVLCGSIITAMSYCNKAAARESVFCWVHPEAISRGTVG